MRRCAVIARGDRSAPRRGLTLLVAVVAWASQAAAAPDAPAASARDVQSGCVVNAIPATSAMSVTWTGECVAGRASGVGDVIAFSAGKLYYILRGQFRDGELQRQVSLRRCADAPCADDVPRSVMRLHEPPGAPASASAAAAPAVPASSAASPVTPAPGAPRAASVEAGAAAAIRDEVVAVDGVYRGRITVDPQTGALSGEVHARYTDGRSFEGTLRNSRKEGRGTYVWPNGLRYSGEWRDDLQHGKGSLTFDNGDVYEGDFVANERTGSGVLRYKNGGSYSGEWLRGARDGRGVEEWPNGQRYEGTWKANRKEGSGSMRFADGNVYDGEWRDDRATGRGDILFASGDTYTGEVRDGMAQGQGIMRWGSGDRFEGEFDAGKPTARGVMTFFAELASSNPGAAADTTAVPAAAATDPAGAAAAGSASPTPAAVIAPPTRATLCANAFNAARDAAAVRRFIESFPDDECARHALARQKLAAWEEQARAAARAASKALDERQANARAFIGGAVAFRHEFPFCVAGSGANCQRVTYVFDVKATVRDVDVQKGRAQVQINDVTSLGNEKGAPSQLFAQGRAAATAEARARLVGSTVSRTFAEVGLNGL